GYRVGRVTAGLIYHPRDLAGRRFRTKDGALLRVFRKREHRVGALEVHHADGVGIRDVLPHRPFGDQLRCTDLVVVVPQETEVEFEGPHQIGEHPPTDVPGGGGVRGHQFGRYAGHEEIEFSRHRCLPTAGGCAPTPAAPRTSGTR